MVWQILLADILLILLVFFLALRAQKNTTQRIICQNHQISCIYYRLWFNTGESTELEFHFVLQNLQSLKLNSLHIEIYTGSCLVRYLRCIVRELWLAAVYRVSIRWQRHAREKSPTKMQMFRSIACESSKNILIYMTWCNSVFSIRLRSLS